MQVFFVQYPFWLMISGNILLNFHRCLGYPDLKPGGSKIPSGKFYRNIFQSSAVVGAAIPAIAAFGALLVEGYARLPQSIVFSSTPSPISSIPPDKDIVIIFPGAGGPDDNTRKLQNKIIQSDQELGIQRFVYCYDWSPWVGNLLRAAFDSESVGRLIGNQVAHIINNHDDDSVRNIHAIGVSVGAFAANSFLSTITMKVSSKKKVYRRLTLLDPFTSRGIFGIKYGTKHFDYFEHYLNTDDPVPTTNEPLPHGLVYDITGAEARKAFVPLPGDNMHSWPVAYLAQSWKSEICKKGNLLQPKHSDQPERQRGTVIKVT